VFLRENYRKGGFLVDIGALKALKREKNPIWTIDFFQHFEIFWLPDEAHEGPKSGLKNRL
jgi:hypothetical protein